MSADVIRAGEVIEGEVVAPPFDYAQLGAETRIVIQQATTEIRDELDVMRRSAAKIGQRLVVVRERLKPLGQWGAWLDREFGWSDQTALNYISVAELGTQNPKFLELESQFARTALTELARDTTPPAAREEAIRRAEAGERVTPRDAKELVQAAKAEGVGAAALAELAERGRRGPAPPLTPTPLPSVTPGRQPYGSPGSGRHVPIVPHVLIIGDRRLSYAPAPLIRAETIYDTAETVRVKRPDGREETKQQHHVYCIPDDAAWATLTAAHEAYTARLTDLAGALRQLGRYDKRLEAAGGLKKAPNPLTATVIGASDPDARVGWVHDPWHLTYLQRKAITRHTAKMLFYHYNPGDEVESSSAQDGYFVCPDDETWARVEALHSAAQGAQRELGSVLNQLGLYKIALADGRYTPAPPAPVELPDHLLPSPAEPADVEIDADDFWEVAPARYAEILRGLDEQALGLLAAALWSRGDLDWVDAERDDLVEALAQELAELLSAELDGANPRRVARIARLLGAGVPS